MPFETTNKKNAAISTKKRNILLPCLQIKHFVPPPRCYWPLPPSALPSSPLFALSPPNDCGDGGKRRMRLSILPSLPSFFPSLFLLLLEDNDVVIVMSETNEWRHNHVSWCWFHWTMLDWFIFYLHPPCDSQHDLHCIKQSVFSRRYLYSHEVCCVCDRSKRSWMRVNNNPGPSLPTVIAILTPPHKKQCREGSFIYCVHDNNVGCP